jgi:hypothetical protein
MGTNVSSEYSEQQLTDYIIRGRYKEDWINISEFVRLYRGQLDSGSRH